MTAPTPPRPTEHAVQQCRCKLWRMPMDPDPTCLDCRGTGAVVPRPEHAEPKKYLPWTDAGGPNECPHGYAEGIPCPHCDGVFPHYVSPQHAPSGEPVPHDCGPLETCDCVNPPRREPWKQEVIRLRAVVADYEDTTTFRKMNAEIREGQEAVAALRAELVQVWQQRDQYLAELQQARPVVEAARQINPTLYRGGGMSALKAALRALDTTEPDRDSHPEHKEPL